MKLRRRPHRLAGAGGFEPPNGGIKILISHPSQTDTDPHNYENTIKIIDLLPTSHDISFYGFATRCRQGADKAAFLCLPPNSQNERSTRLSR